MISIVCVFNDRNILDNFLLKSLNKQNIDYELITLDNRKNEFKSAAEALNYGGKKAQGKYIMFIHQDIDLVDNNWLKNAENILDSLPNLGVAGVAGKLDFMTGIISNISDGIPPKYPGKMKINEPVKVQTLDECLFIVPTDIFKMVKFDEELCDDWHLYAVDICLEILKLGFYVYVMPLYLYHRSAGFSISPKYFQTMLKMIKKYKNDYKWINTTTGDWNTRYPFFIQLQINKLLIKIATMRNGHDIP